MRTTLARVPAPTTSAGRARGSARSSRYRRPTAPRIGATGQVAERLHRRVRPHAVLGEGGIALCDAPALGEGAALALDELHEMVAQAFDPEGRGPEDVEQLLDLLGPGDRRGEFGGRAVRIAPWQAEPGEDRFLWASGFDVLGEFDQPGEVRPEIGRQRPLRVGLDLGGHLLQPAALHEEVRSLRGDPLGEQRPRILVEDTRSVATGEPAEQLGFRGLEALARGDGPAQVAGPVGEEGGPAAGLGAHEVVAEHHQPARAGVSREQGGEADRFGEGLAADPKRAERLLHGPIAAPMSSRQTGDHWVASMPWSG